MTLYQAESRRTPSRTSICLRCTPSNCAGSAAIAPRERSLRASVFSSTRRQPSRSKASPSIRAWPRCWRPLPQASGVSHVQPISMLRCSGRRREVAGAPEHAAVVLPDRRERHLRSGRLVRERDLRVVVHLLPRLRLEDARATARSRVARRLPEPVLVRGRDRLEPYELSPCRIFAVQDMRNRVPIVPFDQYHEPPGELSEEIRTFARMLRLADRGGGGDRLVRAATRRRARPRCAGDHGERTGRGVQALRDEPRVPRPPQARVGGRR